jgi:hypothetical protein
MTLRLNGMSVSPSNILMTIHFSSRHLLGILTLIFALVCDGHAGEQVKRVSAFRVPAAKQVIKAQAGADGTIHLLFDAEDGPCYARSTDDGATFSPPIALVDKASQKPGLKYSAADFSVGKDGRVHVALSSDAWRLKLPEEEWSLYYASLGPGAKAFSPLRNLNRKPSEGFSLAADERGNVAACFLSGKLYTMISHDNGKTFTSPAEPNPAWDPCNCCTSSAAFGPDGRLAVIYREETNNDRDMWVILSDPKAHSEPVRRRLSGTSWNFNACPMTYYTINRTPTGYVAAWPTKGQVYFAQLDKDGRVLPRGEIKTPGTTGMRTGTTAVTASDGTTLVTWKNKDILGWQLYDAEGNPVGEPASVSSPGSGAAAVARRDSTFLVFP